MNSTTRSTLAWVLALALFAMSGSAAAAETAACESKPYVVKIHAAWCGACKAIAPTWEKLEAQAAGQATFVTLDVTDRASFDASTAKAEEIGIGEFFKQYRRQTGTVAVLDCRTLEPVAVLRAERDLSKYQEAIAKAGSAS